MIHWTWLVLTGFVCGALGFFCAAILAAGGRASGFEERHREEND